MAQVSITLLIVVGLLQVVVGAKSCWNVQDDRNAVNGLMWGGVYADDRPNTFNLGYFGSDEDACADACGKIKKCVAWALHKPTAINGAWAGRCYGRSDKYTTWVPQEDVVSGFRKQCDKPAEPDIDCSVFKNKSTNFFDQGLSLFHELACKILQEEKNNN